MTERITSHDPVGLKSLANETNERSYAPYVYGSTGSIRARKFVGSTYAPHVSLRSVDRLLRQHYIKKWLAKKRPKLKAEHARALAHNDGSPAGDLQ